jgi:hypothetical protein
MTGFSPGQRWRSNTVNAAATVFVRSAFEAKSITFRKRLMVSTDSAAASFGPRYQPAVVLLGTTLDPPKEKDVWRHDPRW